MQQQVTITGPAGAWDCDINLLTDPAMPCSYTTVLSTGASYVEQPVQNTQFGVDVPSASTGWAGAFQEWRCAFMGASVYLNASDLYNEGTCTAAQYSLKPRNVALTFGSGADASITEAQIVDFVGDEPTYNNLVRMPNAYTGDAKDGCYMPIKLDNNHATWHDENDLSYSLCRADTTAGVQTQVLTRTTAVGDGGFPYYSLGAYAHIVGDVEGVGGHQQVDGGFHLLPCSSCAGRISFRGLNQIAKINVVLRYGYECRVQPDSQYSSFQALSCPYDMVAVNTYFQICRQLKDAYPVVYNDFGKLWDIIKGVARTVDPFLGLVPGGDIIRMAGKGVGGLVNMVMEKKKKAPKGPPDGPSEAALEAAVQKAKAVYAPRKPRIKTVVVQSAAPNPQKKRLEIVRRK